MFLRRIKYYFRQSFTGMSRNFLMVFISVTTVTFCLMLLGLAMLIGSNLTYVSNQLQSQFEIHAYVDITYTNEQAMALESQVKQISGIRSVTFETKEQALENAKQTMTDIQDALEGLEEDNPLRCSYKIILQNIRYASSVEAALKSIPGIATVVNRTDILNGINRFSSIAGYGSLFAMFLFLIVAVFIISNTIKLSVIARRKEIEIMKLVGATNWFIRWPFIIEGAVLGLIGGVIAFFPVYFGYYGIYQWWTESLNMFDMVPPSSLQTFDHWRVSHGWVSYWRLWQCCVCTQILRHLGG